MRFHFQWILAGILILILSGCDADPPRSRSDILEERLDSIMADIMENEAPPGMLLAVWTPDATYLKALGVSNLETGEPLATDVTYRIGSQTKMYTTTVILQMVDEGKLRLDDTISQHLDGVKGGDGITLFEMMSNTSGLASYSRNEAWQDIFFADPNLVWSPEQLISYTNDLDPLFAPGQGWDYSNTNFVILGLIAEKVDGKSLRKIFRDRLFTKLGTSMSDLPDDIYVPAPTVKGYYESGEGLTRFSDWTLQSPTWAWAAGGLISNVYDSKLWIEAAVDGGLISDNLQKERMSLWVNPANGQIGAKGGYGMGIGNMNGAIGHTGSLPGWNSGSYRLPDQQVTVVFFFNMQSEVVEPAPRLLDEVTNLIKELY